MKLNTFTKASLILSFCSSIALAENPGGMSNSEFMQLNKSAAAQLKAIEPTATALSEDDQELLMDMANGGMMQLELSRVAVSKATSADVKMIAKAEVDEQTGLSAKLMEIAKAKNVTLPTEPNEKTKEALEELNSKTGAEFDQAYLKMSGVKGHQMLNKTMEKVQSDAKDTDLKTVATTTLPLIKAHLKIAKEESGEMKGEGNNKSDNT